MRRIVNLCKATALCARAFVGGFIDGWIDERIAQARKRVV